MAGQEQRGGGRAMACGRIAEVVLLIYDFSTFSNCADCGVCALQWRGRGGGESRRDAAGC